MLDVNDTQCLSGWFSLDQKKLLFTCGHNSGYYFATRQITCEVAEWLRAKVSQVRIPLANFLPKTPFFQNSSLESCRFNPISSIPSHLVQTDMNQGDIKLRVTFRSFLSIALTSFFTVHRIFHCIFNGIFFLRRGFHVRLLTGFNRCLKKVPLAGIVC